MRLILVLIISALPLWSQAQYAESIRSGRPGQSIGAFTVGEKVLQFQSGITFGWSNNNDEVLEGRAGGFIAVVRYGLYERLELSGVVGLTNNRLETEKRVDKAKGLSAAQLGFRVNIRDGQGKGPNIAIQSRLRLNVLSEDYHQNHLGNTTILSLSQSISPFLGMGANIGITWNGNNPAARGRYSFNLNTDITENINVFVENYGDLASGDFDSRYDAGMGFIVTPNLKLDFSFGYGHNDGLEDYFMDLGVSWRFLTGVRPDGT